MSTVRDDRNGMLSARLACHIAVALELLASGSLPETKADTTRWCIERRRWRRETSLMLNREFEREAVAEFLRLSVEARPAGGAQTPPPSELRRLDEAVELLVALHASLAGEAGGERHRGERGRNAANQRLAALAGR